MLFTRTASEAGANRAYAGEETDGREGDAAHAHDRSATPSLHEAPSCSAA
jgi:hypothetical protein